MQKQPNQQWLFFDEEGRDEAAWQALLHANANGDLRADPGQTATASLRARRWWPDLLLLTGLALALFWLYPWGKAEAIATTKQKTLAVPVATTIGRREKRQPCLDLQMNPVEQHRSQLPPPYALPEPVQPVCPPP
jgi:hypothetical protein